MKNVRFALLGEGALRHLALERFIASLKPEALRVLI
jgi:hypothetical protein